MKKLKLLTLAFLLVAQSFMGAAPMGMADGGETPRKLDDVEMHIENLEIGHLKDGVAKDATVTDSSYFLDIDTGKFDATNTYYVKFDFKLLEDHTVQPGDFYTFKVPTAFNLSAITDRALGTEGLATYSVTTGGEITITFTDKIRSEGQAQPIDNGKFDAAWALAETAKTGDLVQNYPFNIGGPKTFTLAVANPGGDTIKKSKVDGHGNNPKTVKWQIDVNTNTKDISGLTLKDSLTVVPDSITVVELEPQITGNPKVGTDTGGYTLDNNSFPITFDNSKKAYRITYETEVGSPGPGRSTISNTATLEGTGGGSDTATHSVYFDEPIKKSVDTNGVQYPGGALEWTVTVNADKRDISGGVTVTDTLVLPTPATNSSADGNLMAFDKDSVNISPAADSYTAEVDGNELTIKFTPTASNKEAEHTITYNTVDEVVDKNYTFTNKAVLTYTDYPDDTYDSGAKTGTVNHKMLTKTGQTGNAIDYLNKTIDWTVTFNTSGYDAINPVVITDTFNSGGKYFRMYEDEFPQVDGFTLALTNEKTNTEDNNRKYTEDGFTLTATSPVESQVTFTYPTHFDSKETYPSNQITNTAAVNWTKGSTAYTNTATATSKFNAFTANNGKKTGIYDPVNKAVEWELDVNYKEFSLPTAKIIDTFGDKQTMAVVDKNTVKVELLEMSANPQPVDPAVVPNYTVTGTGPAGNYTGFELNFGQTIDKAYRVTYTTVYNEQFIGEFSDETNKAKNTAEFTSADNPVTSYDTGTSGLKTSPTVTNAGKYFSKNGRDIPNVDYLEWKFKLNESQSHIKKDSTIKDTMNDGQVLVEDFTGLTLAGITSGRGTFEIKKRNYTRSGNNFSSTLDLLTPEEVNDLFTIAIASDKKSFTLTLKQDINHEYEISYVTDIGGSNSDSLSNTYTYNFIGMETKTETKTISQNVTYEYSGGTANLRRYNLNLTKKDGFTNAPLEGVTFGIYIGNIEVATATTGADGKLTFPEIKYGTYTLKELNAASNEYSTYFKVDGTTEFVDAYTFTTAGKNKELSLKVSNRKTCDSFKLKVIYDGDPVEAGVGVVIKNVAEEEVTTGKTNTEGQIVFDKENLPKGNYKVFNDKDEELGDIEVLYLQGHCEKEITWEANKYVDCDDFKITFKKNGIPVSKEMDITLKDASNKVKSPEAKGPNEQGGIEYGFKDLTAGKYKVYDGDVYLGDTEVSYLKGTCSAVIPMELNEPICEHCTIEVLNSNGSPQADKLVYLTYKDSDGNVQYVEAGSQKVQLGDKEIHVFKTNEEGKITFNDGEIHAGVPYTVYVATVGEDDKITRSTQVGNAFTIQNNCEVKVQARPTGGGGWTPPPVEPEDPDKEDPEKPGEPGEEDPEKPVDPENPEKPGEPGEEDPKDPEDPTKPGDKDPTDPTDPKDPTKPGDKDPTDPKDPTKPVKPTNPTDPTKPSFVEKVIKDGKIDKSTITVKVVRDGKITEEEYPVNEDGSFTPEDPKDGDTYLVTTKVPDKNGNPVDIVISKIKIKINEDGTTEEELIDPYGIIRDKKTGEILEGVKVTLHDSKTGELVELPKLDWFGPNFNKNPQNTVKDPEWNELAGDYATYAWMVFPNRDYYIVAEREGCTPYKSETISVGYDLIKHSFDIECAGTDEVSGEKLPQTGEERNKMIVIGGILLIIAGSSLVFFRRKQES